MLRTMVMINKISCKKEQSGFTLLESLITLFILTIGLLGIAGLNLQSMRAGSVATQRMVVTIKVIDLFERMISNPDNIVLYTTQPAADTGCNTGGTVCSVPDMISHDLFMFQSDLNAALPTVPVVSITQDITTAIPAVTVRVDWTDRNENYFYQVSTQL